MSFIGKEVLYIPPGVIIFQKKNYIIASSAKGVLKKRIHLGLICKKYTNKIFLTPRKSKISPFFSREWGSLRISLWKMFLGVFNPFALKLIFIGIGYRFEIKREVLRMRLGFSHQVCFKIPFSLFIEQTSKRPPGLLLKHIDFMKLKTIISKLQYLKKPEPYKGKGLVVPGQFIYRKQGKRKN